MGAWVCKREDPARVLFMGLDAAGKTTILYRLKLGEVVTTIPTIGFNIETVNINGLEVTCWDVGGRDKIRPLYRHYLPNSSGLVYCIDSSDRERLEDSLDELFRYYMLEDETRDFVFMILANKQDLEGAMSAHDIEDAVREKMKATKCEHNQTVFVCPVSAVTGEGLIEAFRWFLEQIDLKKKNGTNSGIISVDMDRWKSDGTNKDTDNDDKTAMEHNWTKKVFKDPMKYLKSLLFY